MITPSDYIGVLPEIILSVVGMIVMLIEPFLDEKNTRKSTGIFSVFGIILALLATAYISIHPGTSFKMVRVDAFSVFFHVVVLLVALAAVLISLEYIEQQHIRHGEWYALILMSAVGMGLMSSAIELVLIFIALEISSIATYVLAGFRRRAAESAEASLKYFLLGSFATAFFLYGVALMFGATGSTNVDTIAAHLRSGIPVSAYFSLALMFVGLGFKVSAAPFQIWTPDVYEGSPTPIVALMSTGPKATAFAVLLRVFFGAALTSSGVWFWMIWVSAVLSMTMGNIGALVQTNVKRMLAYSSVAQAGYILIAFASVRQYETGVASAIFYTAAYAAMNVGAFAVVSHFSAQGEQYTDINSYAGLGRRSPALAFVLTIFLLSLIGIPITGGFFAKFYVFTAAMQSNLIGLTIIGVLNSAIAAFYYLRLVIVMYMQEPNGATSITAPAKTGTWVAIAICLISTIYLGVLPSRVLDYAMQSAKHLLR